MPTRRLLYASSVALFIYAWASVNIYLPILPELRTILNTSPELARLTVGIFLAGFAVTQVIWGPLSDRFGRRPILLIGMALSCSGAALAGLADDIYSFIAARLLESIGLGVAPVLARAVLSDALDRPHVAIAMAYCAIGAAIMPALGPIIGGYLNYYVSWRAIFFLLAVYGAFFFLFCLFRLPETKGHKDSDQRPRLVLGIYGTMLRDRRFVGCLSIYAISYGGVFGYFAAAPYLFTRDLGYAPREYGFLLIFNIAFYIIGAWVARLLVPRLGIDRIILYAMLAVIISSILFLALESFTTLSTLSVLLPISVFIFGGGFVSPAVNTAAMTAFKEKGGAASALVGFSNAAGGAIFSAALIAMHFTRLWQLALYVAICALLCIASYWALVRRRPGDAPV